MAAAKPDRAKASVAMAVGAVAARIAKVIVPNAQNVASAASARNEPSALNNAPTNALKVPAKAVGNGVNAPTARLKATALVSLASPEKVKAPEKVAVKGVVSAVNVVLARIRPRRQHPPTSIRSPPRAKPARRWLKMPLSWPPSMHPTPHPARSAAAASALGANDASARPARSKPQVTSKPAKRPMPRQLLPQWLPTLPQRAPACPALATLSCRWRSCKTLPSLLAWNGSCPIPTALPLCKPRLPLSPAPSMCRASVLHPWCWTKAP